MITYEFSEDHALRVLRDIGFTSTEEWKDHTKLRKVLDHPDNEIKHQPMLAKYLELYNKKWK